MNSILYIIIYCIILYNNYTIKYTNTELIKNGKSDFI